MLYISSAGALAGRKDFPFPNREWRRGASGEDHLVVYANRSRRVCRDRGAFQMDRVLPSPIGQSLETRSGRVTFLLEFLSSLEGNVMASGCVRRGSKPVPRSPKGC